MPFPMVQHQDLYIKLAVVTVLAVAFVFVQRPNILSLSRYTTPDNVEPILGIDLGSSYMSAAVWTGNEVSIIYNGHGREATPTAITFLDDGRVYIGDDALIRAVSNTGTTFYMINQLIGRAWSDPKGRELSKSKYVGFELVESRSKPAYRVNSTTTYYPEEILAVLLAHIKTKAEDQIHQDIEKAVLTLPAYFNDHQRRAVKNAGKLAKLNVVKTINAPTAVGVYYSFKMAYKHKHFPKDDLKIVVIDFGASHLDVSIITIAEGIVETVASRGTETISGDAINKILLNYFLNEFKKKHNKAVEDNIIAMTKLMKEVERIKRYLSDKKRATLEIENFYGSHFFTSTLSRDYFEELNDKIWTGIHKTIKKLLKETSYLPSEFSDVILTGGSSRIPRVKEAVKHIFKRQNVIHRPELIVTHGAALQGGILSKSVFFKGQLTLDCSTAALGYQTYHGNISVVVPKYTSLPSSQKFTFTTSEHNQTTMAINVFEGDGGEAMAGYTQWGKLVISGIPHYRKEFPLIDVRMMIDERGLYDFAIEKSTVSYTNMTVKPFVRGLKSLEIPGLMKNVSNLVESVRRNQRRENYLMKLEIWESLIELKLSNTDLEDEKEKKLEDMLASIKFLLDDAETKSLSELMDEVSKLQKLTSQLDLL